MDTPLNRITTNILSFVSICLIWMLVNWVLTMLWTSLTWEWSAGSVTCGDFSTVMLPLAARPPTPLLSAAVASHWFFSNKQSSHNAFYDIISCCINTVTLVSMTLEMTLEVGEHEVTNFFFLWPEQPRFCMYIHLGTVWLLLEQAKTSFLLDRLMSDNW